MHIALLLFQKLKRAHSTVRSGGLGGGQPAGELHRDDPVVGVEGQDHVDGGVHHEVLPGPGEVLQLLLLVGRQRGGVLVQQQALGAVGAAALRALAGALLRAGHAVVQQLRVRVLGVQRGEDLVLDHSSGPDAHDPVGLQHVRELREPKKVPAFPPGAVHVVHEEDAVLVQVAPEQLRGGFGVAAVRAPREGGREEYQRIVLVDRERNNGSIRRKPGRDNRNR